MRILIVAATDMEIAPLVAKFGGAGVHMKPSPPGFSYTFDPFRMDGALTIVFLGMIVIFAQIMTKAVEIAEDNAQIV